MRFLVSLAAFSLIGLQAFSDSVENSLEKAKELIEQNKKSEAIKALEMAFEEAHDPEQVQAVTALLVEITPKTYRRRVSFLKYLVQNAPEHSNYYKWTLELGHRAMDHQKLSEAEDWYLRAAVHGKESIELKESLAELYRRQGSLIRAFEKYMDLYSETSNPHREAAKTNLGFLWWEIGPLPSPSFKRALTLADSDREELLESVLKKAPTKAPIEAKWKALYRQWLQAPKAAATLNETKESSEELSNFLSKLIEEKEQKEREQQAHPAAQAELDKALRAPKAVQKPEAHKKLSKKEIEKSKDDSLDEKAKPSKLHQQAMGLIEKDPIPIGELEPIARRILKAKNGRIERSVLTHIDLLQQRLGTGLPNEGPAQRRIIESWEEDLERSLEVGRQLPESEWKILEPLIRSLVRLNISAILDQLPESAKELRSKINSRFSVMGPGSNELE